MRNISGRKKSKKRAKTFTQFNILINTAGETFVFTLNHFHVSLNNQAITNLLDWTCMPGSELMIFAGMLGGAVLLLAIGLYEHNLILLFEPDGSQPHKH